MWSNAGMAPVDGLDTVAVTEEVTLVASDTGDDPATAGGLTVAVTEEVTVVWVETFEPPGGGGGGGGGGAVLPAGALPPMGSLGEVIKRR